MQGKAGDAGAGRGVWDAQDHGQCRLTAGKAPGHGEQAREWTGQKMDRPEKPHVSKMQQKTLGSWEGDDAARRVASRRSGRGDMGEGLVAGGGHILVLRH